MRILDGNRYYLPGTNKRFMHIATVTHMSREYMFFRDEQTLSAYLEEITGGKLDRIDDIDTWNDIMIYLCQNGYTDERKEKINSQNEL